MLKPGGKHEALPKKDRHRRVSANGPVLNVPKEAHCDRYLSCIW